MGNNFASDIQDNNTIEEYNYDIITTENIDSCIKKTNSHECIIQNLQKDFDDLKIKYSKLYKEHHKLLNKIDSTEFINNIIKKIN